MFLTPTAEGATVVPNPLFPVNKGGLCVKGWTAAATLAHPDRLTQPLVRTRSGVLAPVSWDVALGEIADGFARSRRRYGADAVGVFGGGSLTNEKAYLLGKFARVALGTANIDYNGRFCMSSAAAAANRALGLDRGLPFPLEDIPHATVILLVGGNPAETMPPIMQYFEAQQRNGGRLIVVDPRRTATAPWAGRHLRLKPGTDAALANGLLHVLIRDGLVDEAYIATRTEGFEDARRAAMAYWPERVERITGIAEAALVEVAHALGRAPSAMVLTARGPEQQAQGVTNALAYINVALALGAVGKPHSGFGTLTGQGNGQGGREHGQKADQLPGYRRIDERRATPSHGGGLGRPGVRDSARRQVRVRTARRARHRGPRALLSWARTRSCPRPTRLRIGERLASLDTLVVADFFLSETAELADVVLPAAQWAEEDGTMTNLEGRVILRRRAIAPPSGRAHRPRDPVGDRGRARARPLVSVRREAAVFDELRRATAGRDRRLLRHHLRAHRAGGRRVLALPDRRSARARRASSPTGFRRRPAARAFTRRRTPRSPTGATASFRCCSRPAACSRTTSRARRRAARRSCRRSPPKPFAEMHPVTAAHAGVGDGEPLLLTTRRGTATLQGQADAHDPRRHGLRARFTGAASSPPTA